MPHAEGQGRAAVSTIEEPREHLHLAIFHAPLPGSELLLHCIPLLPVYQRFVGILHDDPLAFRLLDLLTVHGAVSPTALHQVTTVYRIM